MNKSYDAKKFKIGDELLTFFIFFQKDVNKFETY